MAKKDKVYMPSGTGGLIRYQETGDQKITLKPEHVVYTVTAIVILEIVLKVFFG
jgi:preprotein translocase subunit Sec61beta